MDFFGRKRDDSERKLHDGLAGEISKLRDDLQNQNAKLQEAESRLQSVQGEYDQVLSGLMSTKKEINDAKKERERLEYLNKGIRMQIDEGRRALRDSHKDVELARQAAADLDMITAKVDDMVNRRTQLDSDVRRAEKHLEELDMNIKEQEGRRAHLESDAQKEEQHCMDLDDLRSQLADITADRDRLQAHRDVHVDMVDNLKQRLAAAEKKLQESVPRQQPDKSVVDAATALVASYRQKLAATQEELAQARKRLDDLERSA